VAECALGFGRHSVTPSRYSEPVLHAFDDDVEDEHVEFLDAVGGVAWDDEGGGGEGAQGAAGLTYEGDGVSTALLCGGGGGLHPAGEDVVVAEVVGDTGEVARIVAGEGGQRDAVAAEAAGEFFAEMSGVAHAAAIAAGEDLAALGERARDLRDDGIDGDEGVVASDEGIESGVGGAVAR
jgi:hypothetical protein